MVHFLGVILIGSLISFFLILKSSYPREQVLPAVGWLGGLLAISSLVLLPWIKLGPPGTIEKNAAWIAGKTEVINTIRELPGFSDQFASVEALNPDDIIEVLEHPVQQKLMDVAESGHVVNGIQYIVLLEKVKPVVALSLIIGCLFAASSILFNFHRLISHPHKYREASKIVSSVTTVCFVILLSKISTYDTFAETDEFSLRLLTTLAEIKVGPGAWWVLLGLFLICISSIADWFPSLVSPDSRCYDDFEDFDHLY